MLRYSDTIENQCNINIAKCLQVNSACDRCALLAHAKQKYKRKQSCEQIKAITSNWVLAQGKERKCRGNLWQYEQRLRYRAVVRGLALVAARGAGDLARQDHSRSLYYPLLIFLSSRLEKLKCYGGAEIGFNELNTSEIEDYLKTSRHDYYEYIHICLYIIIT